MSNGEEGLTILGRCGLRLVSDRVASWEWITLPRRQPRPARLRLAPLHTSAWPDGGVHILAEVPDGKES